jgi:hypothetical protein
VPFMPGGQLSGERQGTISTLKVALPVFPEEHHPLVLNLSASHVYRFTK